MIYPACRQHPAQEGEGIGRDGDVIARIRVSTLQRVHNAFGHGFGRDSKGRVVFLFSGLSFEAHASFPMVTRSGIHVFVEVGDGVVPEAALHRSRTDEADLYVGAAQLQAQGR